MNAITAALAAMLLAVSGSAFGQNRVGSWSVGIDEDGLPYMYTENDSGGILGKWCDRTVDECFWILANATPCDEGMSAPALFNNEKGAETITISCGGPLKMGKQTLYRYVLGNHERMDAIVKAASRVGIAIALAEGEFRVVRFQTRNASGALAQWNTLGEGIRRRSSGTTKDMTL